MTDFYFDQARNILVYPQVSDYWREQLIQAMPEARTFNGAGLAVPRTLRSSQVLRHFGYPVPPIITDENYSWPIEPGKVALPHQKMMSNFALLHPRSFNLSDPGTMKTMAALWMADYIMNQFPRGQVRTLIVGLINVLETVWAQAIWSAFLGHRSCEILMGSGGKRSALLAKKPDFAILNIDGVGVGAIRRKGQMLFDGFSKDLFNDKAIKIVIVDEADGYIDADTKRHRIARHMFRTKPFFTLLTGTPAAQAPSDAHGLKKLKDPDWPVGFTNFRMDTMRQVSQFRWKPKPNGYEKAFKALMPAIRFDIKDVRGPNVPPVTIQKRHVELTESQIKQMAQLKRELQIVLESGEKISIINEGAARTKFLQISMGAVYDGDHKAHKVDASPRYEEVERIIHGTTRKVLIFVPITSIVNLLRQRLSKKWRCEVINGDVLQSERPAIIRAFAEEDDLRIMIADPGSTAHGINDFVVADTVIWMGPVDKVRLWIQGNKRLDRPGQEWPVSVYQIISNPLEREMFRRLETNTEMQGLMLDMVKRGEL